MANDDKRNNAIDLNSAMLLEAWERFSDVMGDYLRCLTSGGTVIHAVPPPFDESERKARLTEMARVLEGLQEDSFVRRVIRLEYLRLMFKKPQERKKKPAPGCGLNAHPEPAEEDHNTT